MKLLGKNLTGTLDNGLNYKVDFQITNDSITAYMYVEQGGIFWVDDIRSAIYAENFKTFTEAFTEVAEKLENAYRIEILQNELVVG